MRRVVLESPYGARTRLERWFNRRYARACVRDSLSRSEAPLASHLLYTQKGVLCDEIEAERQWGINAGLVWLEKADAQVFYVDFGVSRGMKYGLERAKNHDLAPETREIGWRKPNFVVIWSKLWLWADKVTRR